MACNLSCNGARYLPRPSTVVDRFRTSNPRVFGSALLGTDTEGSDLDLLVDALPGATLFDLGGLQAELEDLLGVSVDQGDYLDHMRQAAGDALVFVEGLVRTISSTTSALSRPSS